MFMIYVEAWHSSFCYMCLIILYEIYGYQLQCLPSLKNFSGSATNPNSDVATKGLVVVPLSFVLFKKYMYYI